MTKQPKSITAYKLCTKRDGFYKSYNLPSAADAVIYEEGKTTYPLNGYNQFLFVFNDLQHVFHFLCIESTTLTNFAERFPHLGLFEVKAYNPTNQGEIVARLFGESPAKTHVVVNEREGVWLCSHMDVLKRLA